MVDRLVATPLLTDEAATEALTFDRSTTDYARTAAVDAIQRLYADAPTDPTIIDGLQRLLHPEFDLGMLYDFWRSKFEEPNESGYARMEQMIADMAIRPTFSFVVPVYNTPVDLLRECLDSMLAQNYPEFELCVADDASTDPAVASFLHDYAARDPRVKVAFRKENGHISEASNSATRLASGDFVVLVDHDDVIPDYALFVVAEAINGHPHASVFFSDEDKIDLDGHRHSPYFKGDFNRFLMYGHNMFSHLGVYRRSLIEEIG